MAGDEVVASGEVESEAVAAPSGVEGGLAGALTASTAGLEGGVGSPVEQAAVASEWKGVREYAKERGVELPYGDDASALDALILAQRQAGERNYYADLGRRVAPHAGALSEYLASRQQQAAVAPAPWQPPEFKKEWLGQVELDENTGLLRSKAGYDPAVGEKVQAYKAWRDAFLDNPEVVVAPLVEERARAIVQEEMASRGQDVLAASLVSSHAGWMFASDAQGSPVVVGGQRQLTPEGVLYAQSAKRLWDSGLRDVRVVDGLSRVVVENAVLRQRLVVGQGVSEQGGGVQGSAAAATAASVAAAARPAGGGAQPAVSQKGLSLRERLAVNLERAGVGEDTSW